MPARWTLPHRFGLRYNSPWQGKVLEAQRLKTVTQITDGSHVFFSDAGHILLNIKKEGKDDSHARCFFVEFLFSYVFKF